MSESAVAIPATAGAASDGSDGHEAAGVPAFVWGYNARAGLGLGHTAAQVTTPTPTRLPAGTVDVQGGVNFTVALTHRGELFAWGGNQYGQLGDGTTTLRWEPTRVKLPRDANVAAIAVGADHVIARTGSGEVLAWGRNHRGQIGNGTTTDQHHPVVITRSITTRVSAVSAGNGISAVVTRSGDVFVWGRNSFGQLGLGTHAEPTTGLTQSRPAKARLPRGADAVAVDAGNRHLTVALRDGRLMMFGLDAAGRPTKGTIALKSAWGRPVEVCAGEDFTLVLTNRHTLLAIGGNASGQLGVGDRVNRLTPAVVTLPAGAGHVVDVWAGARNAVALTSSGQVYTWGDGNVGQHGTGSTDKDLATQPTPRQVKGLAGTRVTGVSGGAHHVIITATHIKNDHIKNDHSKNDHDLENGHH